MTLVQQQLDRIERAALMLPAKGRHSFIRCVLNRLADYTELSEHDLRREILFVLNVRGVHATPAVLWGK
jgi:hypothetical protein